MPSTTTRHQPVSFGVRFPPCTSAREVAEAVALSERKGFDTAWIADSQLLWRDVFATMALAADRTEHIRLASAVTNFVTRHPSVVASAANTLNELAPGRVLLGVGTGDSSVKPLGMRPSRLAEMREAISTTRTLLAGEQRDFGNRRASLRDAAGEVAIHIAASGPRSLGMAGEVADGVLTLAGISPETVAGTWKSVEDGAAKAGRAMSELDFTVGAFCKITDDIERDAAILKPICLHLASIGAQDYLRIAGIDLEPPPAIPEVYPDMVHAEDWDLAVEKASRYVTDDMAVRFSRAFCLFGTVEEILDRIRAAIDLGATGFYLRHVGNYTLPLEVIETFGDEIIPRFTTGTVGGMS
ncbi:5,10-methylene tetrahydromethanopterin reductase [Prauserella marina]|uniref:5,10-methylenetetrahydromethanopterin reductase n=1 Tax=Prauserella marina TaxID=530584 RepID=A0A222VMT7_9PSEU|nr:LLM class flavin-dependent oxidoreductase [Prauserella marina]ASR35238.1 5,10-methylene tetrahydromethanopterin reductase [Prauserella marina]PWV84990.1 alkanesulfonate monooxygenase SsuD/methylene tetrahydromethanopterin reductase-like flavin-dependent oxidoreductase (luciferase family) [Prauserella marina]SDC07443.1 5,10-methylenetetrahydromethanopterin reductase [Prauserella marina]